MRKFIILLILLNLLFPAGLKAENFRWPSDGFIGWKYYTNTNKQEGIDGTYHTGIDIWGNSDGSWKDGITGNSNPVYPAYQGDIIYKDGGFGMIIKHSNSLYTKYWHLKNQQVTTYTSVSPDTILGYQDNAGGAVHIHMTVASSSLGNDTNYTIDPSLYFGVQLDQRQPNAVGWMYKVNHSTNCGGANVVISNQQISGVNCSATNSIVILPNSRITSNSRYFIN